MYFFEALNLIKTHVDTVEIKKKLVSSHFRAYRGRPDKICARKFLSRKCCGHFRDPAEIIKIIFRVLRHFSVFFFIFLFFF